jgi:benzoate/toluate 1,2-dioxygenase reductase subunit
MPFPIHFVFSDGCNHTIEVDEGSGILAATRKAGLELLVDCEEGICGTCQARVTCGTVAMDDFSDGLLSASEQEDGAVLVCRSRATAPAVIELPYTSADALVQADARTTAAKVTGLREVSSDTMALTLETGEPIHYLPGQYVNISPTAGLERSFSMAGAPGSRELTFYVALRPDGRFSKWLGGAAAGDKVQLGAPKGTFFLRDDRRPKVMIAGGTGLAPILAMLQRLAEGETTQREVPVTVLVGGRSERHLFELGTLEHLRDRLPRLAIHVACDEAEEGSPLRRGRVTELLDEIQIDRAATIYACGPPPMVEAARQASKRHRIPSRQFLAEKFIG